MKKVLAVFAVLVMVGLSTIALAADVTVGGEVALRSRLFTNLLANEDLDSAANRQMDTQTRVKVDVNVKAGDNVKGKIELWSDFNTWGRLEKQFPGSPSAAQSGIGFREAWVNFNIPGIPVNVTGGHQLLALGHGYFFVSRHFGSDAWVVANVTGNNTLAAVNIKAFEGNTFNSDDADAYVLLDVYKISDDHTVGIDLTNILDRKANFLVGPAPTGGATSGTALGRAGFAGAIKRINLLNLGLNYTGKLGPVNLKAEGDYQGLPGSEVEVIGGGDKVKFKGWQAIVKGDVAMDPFGINFTLGMGSGFKKDSNDFDQIVTVLDIDPHMAFLYEYKLPTPANMAINVPSQGAANDHLNTGFANLTAANIGASYAVTKSLKVGLNYWFLQSTEKFDNAAGEETNEVGQEIDANINWKLYDNLAWNWNIGYFLPGKGYDKANGDDGDAAMGVQGILSMTF